VHDEGGVDVRLGGDGANRRALEAQLGELTACGLGDRLAGRALAAPPPGPASRL
jgi:hypothetical protein